jgi:hypothetical protein
VTYEAQRRHRGLQLRNLAGGRVFAAVVDVNDLVVEQPVQRGADLGRERCDVAGLVPDRNDDGQFHANDEFPRPKTARSPLPRRPPEI